MDCPSAISSTWTNGTIVISDDLGEKWNVGSLDDYILGRWCSVAGWLHLDDQKNFKMPTMKKKLWTIWIHGIQQNKK